MLFVWVRRYKGFFTSFYIFLFCFSSLWSMMMRTCKSNWRRTNESDLVGWVSIWVQWFEASPVWFSQLSVLVVFSLFVQTIVHTTSFSLWVACFPFFIVYFLHVWRCLHQNDLFLTWGLCELVRVECVFCDWSIKVHCREWSFWSFWWELSRKDDWWNGSFTSLISFSRWCVWAMFLFFAWMARDICVCLMHARRASRISFCKSFAVVFFVVMSWTRGRGRRSGENQKDDVDWKGSGLLSFLSRLGLTGWRTVVDSVQSIRMLNSWWMQTRLSDCSW